MNSGQDWDVIWKWHWFRRPLWQAHFGDAEHPEGRHARRLPMWREVLQQHAAHDVLDCNCGLGLRAILLQQNGHSVVGTDISAVGVQHARELAQMLNVPVTFEQCPWSSLGERFPSRFDAVLTDAMAWILTRSEIDVAFQNFAAVLRPGGIVLFTGIDQWVGADERARRAEHAWKSAPRFQLRANYGQGNVHMDLVVARDRDGLAITENFLFVVHENGAAHLEIAQIRSTLEWSWEDFVSAAVKAGFHAPRTVRVVGKDREHHVNVAQLP